MAERELPPPLWEGETEIEREERRLTPYMPLLIGAVIVALLAGLWRIL